MNNFVEKLTDSNIEKKIKVENTVEKMIDGDVLKLESNCIKNNKHLSFSGKITEVGTLYFKRIEDGWGSGYVTIDSKKIEVYDNFGEYKLRISVEHGLSIKGETFINMFVRNDEILHIEITSNSKSFSCESPWIACRGTIALESSRSELSNVSLAWECNAYNKEIWVFGDSYLSLMSKARWPYYVLNSGYDKCMYSGFPGAPSETMYHDWKTALTHGTPKYAVWCLGMNNRDTESDINSSWLGCVKAFIRDCEERNIIPILSTVPNVPERIHTHKNEYVVNSGYRYVDFATAVGATEKGSQWLKDYLSSDMVHPDINGAKALSERFIKDLSDILK